MGHLILTKSQLFKVKVNQCSNFRRSSKVSVLNVVRKLVWHQEVKSAKNASLMGDDLDCNNQKINQYLRAILLKVNKKKVAKKLDSI